MAFRKAVKEAAKARVAFAGPAGSGKTFSAMSIATALADGGRVAVVDTERGSASKYADIFDFDVMELTDYHPDRYVEAIQEAVAGGYAVIILDSLSHGWMGPNGLLDQVARVSKLRYHGAGFNAWNDPEIRGMEARLIAAITGSDIHVIATMRSKTEYAVEQNERGKAAPRKVGTAPVQRDNFEFEFDVFAMMTQENEMVVQKTRCMALAGAVIPKPGKQVADILRKWCEGMPATNKAPNEPPPTTPAAAAPDEAEPWRLSGDVEILDALNRLGVRGQHDIAAFLTEHSVRKPITRAKVLGAIAEAEAKRAQAARAVAGANTGANTGAKLEELGVAVP